MIRRILLDIDDVCNQCTKYALQWLDVPMDYDRFYETYPFQFRYQIVEAANHLLGYRRFDVPGFWNMIPRTFWATCPVSDEYEYILNRCVEMVGRENICFLTGPTKDPDCLAGKIEWVSKFAPEWMHRQYLVGPRKQFCAHSEALLIDDSDANIDTFRAWGGTGLLVPRPWNSLHGVNTMDYLSEQFQSLTTLRSPCPVV